MTGPWTISIPFRTRDESLVDVAAHARHLGQDEDRATTRQLVISAQLDGVATTAGGLLDYLAQLEPHQRRGILDRARAEVGLPSVEEVESQRPKPLRVRTTGAGGSFPTCAAKGCNAVPMRFGAFYNPVVRRWHCPAHEHLAEPGDLEPRGSGLKLSPSGVPIPDDLIDDQRERDREEIDANRRATQTEQRAVEAAEHNRSKQARDEAHRSELPPHLRPRPEAA